jgi:hypothetical protein
MICIEGDSFSLFCLGKASAQVLYISLEHLGKRLLVPTISCFLSRGKIQRMAGRVALRIWPMARKIFLE